MSFDNIPARLKEIPHWLVWRDEKRNGKHTKVPYDAKAAPRDVFAKVNTPETWTDYTTAVRAADPFLGSKFDGIGFVLLQTDLVGIDFDGVLDDGVPEPYVLSIVHLLGNPYCEVTPSCTGLRVFVEYDKPLPPGNKFAAKKKGVEKYGAEIYAGNGGGRYLTVTGDKFNGGEGIPRVDDAQLNVIHFLISQFGNEKFKRWWVGDSSDYAGDDSRLDMALMGFLARQFNGDIEKMEQLFTLSAPGHREKWVNRADYRKRTIAAALAGKTTMPEDEAPDFPDIPQDEPQPRRTRPANEPRPELVFTKPAVEGGTSFDYVVGHASEDGNKKTEGWFPLGNPSIVAGASGAGKSTLMLDICIVQLHGGKLFEHETHQLRYVILTFDRGQESNTRTLWRMGYTQEAIPMKFLHPVYDSAAAQEIITKIEEMDPLPQLVFIEGIDMLVSDPMKPQIVTPFMHEMQQIATHFHIALIGSAGAPKTKPGEGYAAKRDTVFGSGMWTRLCETVVTLQFPEGDDTKNRRALTVMMRNSEPEAMTVEFQGGRLVRVSDDKPEEEKPRETKLQTTLHEAMAWLEAELQQGPKQAKELIIDAKGGLGVGETNLRAAARQLGVIMKPTGPGLDKIWMWSMPKVHATAETVAKKTQSDPVAVSETGDILLPGVEEEKK